MLERPFKATPTLTKSNGVEDDDHPYSTLNNAITEVNLIKAMGVRWTGFKTSSSSISPPSLDNL